MRTFKLGIVVLAIGVLGFSHIAIAENQLETFDVEISPEGVGTVRATLTLPAERERVRSVLMDYPNWPKLFPRTPKIHNIKKVEDRVRVDMSVPAFFLPMTLQLVTETHEPQPFRIVTQMVEGDFERYDWVWELFPTQGGTHTLASLTFNVKPPVWTPDWALLWMLESDLQEHFEILRAEVNTKDAHDLPASP
jgi:ribosome-associated toxin RatA of RatAB toxin-antitoxin module